MTRMPASGPAVGSLMRRGSGWPWSRSAMTSRIEPLALRAASALSAVAVLWIQWWAMKWYFKASLLPMRSPVWLMESLTIWAVTGGTRATRSASSRVRAASSARGTTRLTRPSRQASWASMVSPVKQELLGLADPELPRLDQQLHPGAGQAQHRVGEHGVVGGHDQVAHAGQHEAGRDAAALDGGDGRLAEVVDAQAAVEVHGLLVVELALGGLAHRHPRVGPVAARPGP